MTNEALYNGIILPQRWPPRDVVESSREPIPVPYLANPPEVIPIDLGRQLFVDDFLIDETSLRRVFGKPEIHAQSPVLQPETEEEMDSGFCPMAAPFNDGAWYDPQDSLFKLRYMPGWFHSTALATSADGIHWERPQLDITQGTNLVGRTASAPTGTAASSGSTAPRATTRSASRCSSTTGTIRRAGRMPSLKAGCMFCRTASTGASWSSRPNSATTPPSSTTLSGASGE